jgi:hypothetical protein
MRIVGQLSVRRVPQTPRHPEVNQESTPRLEPNNQIFATAFERSHAFAFELGRDCNGLEWAHKPWVVYLDAVEPPADEMRLQLQPDRLDLWQLRHQAIVSSTIGREGGASAPIT